MGDGCTYAHIINDIVKRALDAAKIPAIWNPQASIDRMASNLMEPPLFLGEVGSAGVGCPDTLAPSCTSLATREVDVVANEAEKKKKKAKYTE